MPKPVDPRPLTPPARDLLVLVTTGVVALLLIVLATSQLMIARRTETSAVAASVQRRHDPRRSQRGADREGMAHEPVELDGVLHIEATESVYATSAFRLDSLSARLALTDD